MKRCAPAFESCTVCQYRLPVFQEAGQEAVELRESLSKLQEADVGPMTEQEVFDVLERMRTSNAPEFTELTEGALEQLYLRVQARASLMAMENLAVFKWVYQESVFFISRICLPAMLIWLTGYGAPRLAVCSGTARAALRLR